MKDKSLLFLLVFTLLASVSTLWQEAGASDPPSLVGVPKPSIAPTCASGVSGFFGVEGGDSIYACAGVNRVLIVNGAGTKFGTATVTPTPTVTATLTPTPTVTVTP